ncbi:hypothetical protein Pmani_030044 [Petrolisthes manimaculis]|uniref:Uncharacterized protein n=1 Tax=Petrolisthes manimaculis TaxID=1843537 RepID=A0AAE1NWU5_9EUCA|nr:hypothetical protein Pmani_030044 [Petrolisthes manimaculis]
MATKITKWTRDKPSVNNEFVDPTRRSHQPLAHHLTAQHTHTLYQLATQQQHKEDDDKQRKNINESREDAVVRRRIAWLRAQLHEVTLGDKSPTRGSPKAPKATGRKQEEEEEDEKVTEEEVERLRKEADKRKEVLSRVRTYIPVPPSPVTPKERGRKIHAKVVEVRREQVKEKEEQRQQKRREEEGWSRRTLLNQQKAEEQIWREQEEQRLKRDKLRRDLDILCEEREKARVEERKKVERQRQDLNYSHHVYNIYSTQQDQQAAIEKKKRREELEQEIAKVKEARAWDEEQEATRREEELRYSEVKRAFARRVKQSTLDKMKGKRITYISPPSPTPAVTFAKVSTSPTVSATSAISLKGRPVSPNVSASIKA